MRGHISAALLIAALAAPLTAALAQEGEPAAEAAPETAAPAPASGNRLADEIIVTAQKRAQSLMDVPLSVTAIGGETLENMQVNDLRDVVNLSPSLSVVQTTNTSVFNLVIRGQGPAAQERGVEQSVGVFIDGIYRGRPAMAMQDLISIERIELLKGPQSSIFGRNNTAGAVSIVTQKPDYEFGGRFDAAYSRFNTVNLRASATGPIWEDHVAVRLSAAYRKQSDGDIKNLSGPDQGQTDRKSIRGQALFDFTQDTSLRVIADYTKMDDRCCQAIPYFWSDGAIRDFQIFGGSTPGVEDGTSGSVNGVSGVFVNPFERVVAQDGLTGETIEDWGFSAEFNQDFGPVLLTALGAHRETKSRVTVEIDASDASGTTVPVIDLLPINLPIELPIGLPETLLCCFLSSPETDITETQFEVRLTSQTSGWFDWLVGYYLFMQTVTDHNVISALFVNSTGEAEATAHAFFGQGVVHFTNALTLTAGLRYNTETKDFTYTGSNILTAPLFPYPSEHSVSDSAVLGDIAISYDVIEDATLYARYGRGYKSPGANLLPAGSNFTDPSQLEFEAENTNAFELGGKFTFIDNLYLTFAGFYQRTNNQQVQIANATTLSLSVENAAQARARGLEFEFTWKPADRFSFVGGVTWLDSIWEDYKVGSAPVVKPATGPAAQDLSGEPTLQAPRWAASMIVEYQQPLFDGLITLTPRAGVNYRSPHFTTTGNDALFENDHTFLVDASVELSTRYGVALIVWGKNLTNEEIILNG